MGENLSPIWESDPDTSSQEIKSREEYIKMLKQELGLMVKNDLDRSPRGIEIQKLLDKLENEG